MIQAARLVDSAATTTAVQSAGLQWPVGSTAPSTAVDVLVESMPVDLSRAAVETALWILPTQLRDYLLSRSVGVFIKLVG